MKRSLSILAALMLTGAATAEMTFSGNPALVTRPDAMRVNPALAAWQPLSFGADWQLLNSGLTGSLAAIGQGGFQVSVPRVNMVLLGDTRDTDLLAETELGLNWALRLKSNLSVGVDLGLRRFGWNRDRISDDVLNDPVFRDGLDRIQPALGAGVFWAPRPNLHAGLGLKRLNRPSLSLVESSPHAPVRGYAGMAWHNTEWTVGLAWDNLRNQTAGGGIGGELVRDLQPSMQAAWQAMEQLTLWTDLRRDGATLEFDLKAGLGHEVAYAWTLPLGDLADYSSGSHRLSWRYNLGGALVPGSTEALPADTWLDGAPWLDALRRHWDPARAPLRMSSRSNQIETVELHVHVAPELLARLKSSGVDPQGLAGAGLDGSGRTLQPGESGVVRGTWSRAWWELSGWLEKLSWEQGLSPVIHVGEETSRLEDVANLLGAELDLQPPPRLPQAGILIVPDTLLLDLALPEALAKRVWRWSARAALPGAEWKQDASDMSLPAVLAIPLTAFALTPGETVITLEAWDKGGHPLVVRELRIPVVRRVRHAHLKERDAGPLPGDVDRIYIHLNDE